MVWVSIYLNIAIHGYVYYQYWHRIFFESICVLHPCHASMHSVNFTYCDLIHSHKNEIKKKRNYMHVYAFTYSCTAQIHSKKMKKIWHFLKWLNAYFQYLDPNEFSHFKKCQIFISFSNSFEQHCMRVTESRCRLLM